jgi:P-type Ca2+ transporter type 2C
LLYDKSMRKAWHNFSIKKAFQELGSSDKGLTRQQAKERLKKFGLNQISEDGQDSKLKIFLEQIKSPLVYILLIAGIVTFFLSEYTDTLVIFGAVLLNTLIGYLQENKASQALVKLKKVLRVKSVVLRDGKKGEVIQKNLVPGDVIFLKTGGKVPADARIIENNGLMINESALTGEWMSSKKNSRVLPEKTPLADRDNMVYMGTIVESGWGKAVVVNTGMSAEIGRVAQMIRESKEKKTPYQKKLRHFSKVVGFVIMIVCAVIFLEGMFTRGKFIEMFTTSIAIAVAAIPEGLPVAITVILALGMQRILKRKGLVRRLASAETLGSTSIILTDKTGTLTEGKMEVSGIFTGRGLDASFNREALKIVMCCNESFIENLDEPMAKWIIRGRPTEKALLLAGIQAGFNQDDLDIKQPLIDQFLFDPAYKYAVSLRESDSKNNILYVVGSPEKLLGLSSYLSDEGKEKKLLITDYKKVKGKINKLAEQGLRVIAVARKKIPSKKSKDYQQLTDLVEEMVFVGLIALHDPIREKTGKVINICRQAGMRPIIVTGDHKLTALTVANKLGFKVSEKEILEGQDLSKISDKDFGKIFSKIKVYARVEPAQKLRIVRAWQERGEVVAMTGDGINDAPALKKADIGIALGSGSDIAREVSDLVLLTDNFNVIVAAIEEGRAIVNNIRKTITYLLSDSFSEVILVGVSLLLGWPLPILAAQILWVNLIEDGPLGICLAFEKKEKGIMKQKPKSYRFSLLNKEMKTLIFIIGLVTDVLLLGLFFFLLKYSGYEMPHIRSVIFAGLTIDSLFYIFSCKSLKRNLWQINLLSNKFLIFSWLFGIIMLLIALYIPFFQGLLKTVPLNLVDWGLVLVLGILNMFLIESTKYYFITHRQAC